MDAYPHVEGAHFTRFVGAAIGCWIPTTILDAEKFSKQKLLEEGWEVCSVLERSVVDGETYAHEANGRVEYEQAVTAGFAAHVHVREREVLPLAEGCELPQFGTKNYAALVLRLRSGGWSLFAEDDEQYANGVTPDGDDFVPLWTTSEAAARWNHHWPDYEVTRVQKQELAGDAGLLAGMVAERMWAAVELGDALVTVHPALLRRDLTEA